MSISWIFHIATRYFKTTRREKGHAATILATAGIAVGVMALITIISIMNEFQLDQIANINEIRSFHIRIESGRELSRDIEQEILSIEGVNSLNLFADTYTLIPGVLENRGAALRAVKEDVIKTDQGFAERLNMVSGDFDLSQERSVVLGFYLADALKVRVGDHVSLLSLSGKGYDNLSPINIDFEVKGIFSCGYFEIDNAMAFIPMDSAYLFVPEDELLYGIKLDNHYKDSYVLSRLKGLPSLNGYFMESWRDYNSSLFGVLLMEKRMMMVLVSLIFIVVSVNIFHSIKRSVVNRIEEIAVLKAVGANPFSIQAVYLIEGLMIGVLGSFIGSILGLLISYNLNSIFQGIKKIIDFISSSFLTDDDTYTGFSLWGLTEFTAEVFISDVAYINCVAIFSTLLAAWFASRKISSIHPIEILHYE